MSNPHPRRTGKSAAHPTIAEIAEQQLFELEILRLAVEEQLTGVAIARRLGIHKSTVTRVMQRIQARNEAPLVEQKRARERAALEASRAKLLEIIQAQHVVVSNGKVTDERDYGPVIAALREWRQVSESLRKLDGLDAPAKTEVRVTDDLTAEIEFLAAELAGADRLPAGGGEEAAAGHARSET